MKREVKLITGRTLDQGIFIEHKHSDEYLNAAAICRINPKLMKEIGVDEGDRVKVITDVADVVVRAVGDDNIGEKMIFVPMGPWANFVLGMDVGMGGMPSFKGVDAKIESTDEKTPKMEELMERYRYIGR
jgi:Formylmethanofuran dehydrogenase subunit D